MSTDPGWALPVGPVAATAVIPSRWQEGLPELLNVAARMREVRVSDAAALCTALATEEVSRFISPPPTTVEGFEKFLAWVVRERAAGTVACFAMTAPETDTAVGLIQVRALEPGFGLAEWGFALGQPYWGTGLFMASAALMLRFTFDVLGVRRLEARAAVQNGRGNGALRKLHATQEGCLRSSLQRGHAALDQYLWAVLADEWRYEQTLAAQRLSLASVEADRSTRLLSH